MSETLGLRIKTRRKELKMTQGALGAAIGKSTTSVCRIEKDEVVPSPELLSAIYKALDMESEQPGTDSVVTAEESKEAALPFETSSPATAAPTTSEVLKQNGITINSLPPPPASRVKLGKTERNNWLFINGFVHKIGHIVDEFKQLGREPSMIDLLQNGTEMVAKGMAQRLNQCEPDVVKGLQRESHLLDLAIAHRSDAARWYKKFYEEDRAMRKQAIEELGPDPISDLAEVVLLSACMNCTGDPCQSKAGCNAFRAMEQLKIPYWDDEHPKCKYAGSGLQPGEVTQNASSA